MLGLSFPLIPVHELREGPSSVYVLSEVKQTSCRLVAMSAYDPKRT
jgi:hypothetical protein